MKKLLLLLTALSLFSCSYEKRLKKWCARCPQKDSVSVVRKDSVIVKDTTFFITLAGDTITRMLPCPEKPFEVKKKKNGIVTVLKSDGKTITAESYTDSLKAELKKYKEKEFVEIDSSKSETVYRDSPETWWQITYRVGFWILLLLVILYFLGKRFLKSIPFP